ncbi:MAG: serine hydrolase [Bacteroidetes bacterium]|nr:serine hydrolase [Bacteroidota bacterium]
MKKIIWIAVTIILLYGINYCRKSFPIISGYGAKNMCSAVFLAHRNEQDVRTQELGFFPMKLGTFKVNYQDSSVTGSVFGFAACKAIFRHRLGATLVNEITEDELRKQHFEIPDKPMVPTENIYFPAGDKLPDSIPKGVDLEKLKTVVQNAFVETDEKKLIRTRAVIVLYQGQLIAEQYATGFDKNTPLLGWSMTKSVTSALMGILVKNKELNIEAPAPVPEWKDTQDPRHNITLKNILQQCSGLQYEENYGKSSEATRMLFQKADMAAYTAACPLQDKPGSVFYYSSGNTNILSRIIRQTVGDKNYYSFVYDSLLYPLGMYHTTIEPDGSGTLVGSSYMYAPARDWARFGLLYLNQGFFNGKQIITKEWVQQTTTPAACAQKGNYGFQFWLNAGEKNKTTNREYPSAPTDMFYADGYEGQRIFIIPSKKVVVVRLGLTQYKNWNSDAFIRDILSCF